MNPLPSKFNKKDNDIAKVHCKIK